MSKTESRVVKFNYILYTHSRDHSIDNFDDINSHIEKLKVKKNVKAEIANYISRKLSSIGNLYLISEQTDNINTNKGILLGKSGGRTGTNNDNYIFMYDLSLITVLDGDRNNSLDKLYKSVMKIINNHDLKFDMTQFDGLNGKLEHNLYTEVSEPKGIYSNNKFSSYSDENLTSTIPPDVYYDEDITDEIARNGDINDPFVQSNNDDPEQALEKYNIDTQVESYKEEYNDKTTEIRKPTKNEIDEIIEKITNHLHKMVESDGYIYLDDIPKFWNSVECSNPQCKNNECDIYNFHKNKIQNILKKQMKQGFGFTHESKSKRKPISSNMSNFYLDKDGNIYFRPEEVISWIIDYIHYVEPMCGECHSNVGGDSKHTNSIQESETIRVGKKYPNYYEHMSDINNNHNSSLEDDSNLNDNIPRIKDNIQELSIDTDDNISDSDWNVYRTPYKSECDEIMKRVIQHLYKLGTREGGASIKHIYDTIMKRKSSSQDVEIDLLKCESCKKDLDFSNIEKHHPFPVKLREVHMDIVNTVNMNPQKSPIIVNDSMNEFIFDHTFLWRLESHINNLNLSALTCSDCDSNTSNDSNTEYIQKTITKDNERDKSPLNRDEIYNSIHNITLDESITEYCKYNCAVCMSKQKKNEFRYNIYNNQPRDESGSNIIIFNKYNISIDPETINNKFIGFCPDHIDNLVEGIKSENPINKTQVKNDAIEYIQFIVNNI